MPLPTSPISVSNPLWAAILKNLQCNIVKHHGRNNATHIFFTIKKEKIAEARAWVKKLKNELKSAWVQLDEVQKFKDSRGKIKGGTVETISFTKTGIDKLVLTFAASLNDAAFVTGMKNRPELNDNTAKFDSGFKNDIDALLIVADETKTICNKQANKRLKEIKLFATVQVVQKGKVEKNGEIGVEHFGYADGISQPLFLDTEIAAQHSTDQWNDAGNANTLLVTHPQTGQVLGSYFVFRKLEQNVKGFKAAEQSQMAPLKAKHLCPVHNAAGVLNEELPGAMVVGRFEDGTPTALHSQAIERQSDKEMDNDFDYSKDTTGSKCPFHAHIRITNPRADGAGVEFNKTKRITRRGIPYNDTGKARTFKPEESINGFTKNLGLLFMCYQSSIVNQFEFMQITWANQGNVGRPVGQDGIIGQGANNFIKQLPEKWGNATATKQNIDFNGFVTTKGGEYFFTPVIDVL